MALKKSHCKIIYQSNYLKIELLIFNKSFIIIFSEKNAEYYFFIYLETFSIFG